MTQVHTRQVEVVGGYAFDVDVQADSGWQGTGISVSPGEVLHISYLSGLWVGRIGDPFHGPEGPTYDAYPGGKNYPLPGVVEDCLVGRINQSVFYVGRQLRMPIREAGVLELTINDIGHYDNRGQITMRVVVTR